MRKAGLAGFKQWSNDGYAPIVRTIWERVVELDPDALADWRERLAQQMARSVGERSSRTWIEKPERQIAVLSGLSGQDDRSRTTSFGN